MTYAQLIHNTESIASDLMGCGVRPWRRVALVCEDSIEYVVLSLAVLSLRATIVPVSPSLSATEQETLFERMGVHYVLRPPAEADAAGPGETLHLGAHRFAVIARGSAPDPDDEYRRLEPAFIRFSSGTTGASKGVLLSHKAIIDRTAAANRGLKITSDDTILWVLSMNYHFVVTILLFLREGATIVLAGSEMPRGLIRALSTERITFIYAAPFHYRLMSSAADITAGMLTAVRAAVSTAMALPESVSQSFKAKYGFQLSPAYGIIEVGLPFMAEGRDVKDGSVGRLLPDYEVRIDDPDPDGVGTILVRGPGMFDAYYSPWRTSSALLTEGWFDTGDLGRIDADGFLFIEGRAKSVINFLGMKIFPEEVERVLDLHPAVKESCVYGVAHSEFGECPGARVVPAGDAAQLPLDDLRRHCYRHLASFKVPKEFTVVEQIARTASGKIKRSG